MRVAAVLWTVTLCCAVALNASGPGPLLVPSHRHLGDGASPEVLVSTTWSLRFGRLLLSPSNWRRLQTRVDCWAERGRWRQGGDAAAAFGDRLWVRSGSEVWLRGIAHAWIPQADCDLPLPINAQSATVPAQLAPWRRDEFCRVMGGRGLLVVGDSMTRQFHHALQDLATTPARVQLGRAGRDPHICTGNGMRAKTCRGHLLCEGTPNGSVWLQWRRSDRLRLDLPPSKAFELKKNFGEEHWLPDLRKGSYGVLVLNRGAHYEDDVPYLKQMRTTLAFLRDEYPDLTVIVRNTVPGHAKCTSARNPLSQPPSKKARLPFHWHEFHRQNVALRDLVTHEFPGVLYLDVESSTTLRPDLHLIGRSGRDCLHYRNPGPVDNWVNLFTNALSLAERMAAATVDGRAVTPAATTMNAVAAEDTADAADDGAEGGT